MTNTTAIVSLAALAGAAWYYTRPAEDSPTENAKRVGLGAWATPETFPYTTQDAHPDLLPEGTSEWLSFSVWKREFQTEDGVIDAFRVSVGPRGKQFSVKMIDKAMASPSASISGQDLPYSIFQDVPTALDAIEAYLAQYQDELAAL